MFTQIPIDLEVYKVIEAGRVSFDEPHNAILRRMLGVRGSPPPVAILPDRLRSLRASGEYNLSILGENIRVRSLREALREALLRVEASQPGFLEKLTARPTARGRRIVARNAADIYPNKPQLIQHAAPLNSEWYFDTNISRRACERYLVIIGLVANIDSPRLV